MRFPLDVHNLRQNADAKRKFVRSNEPGTLIPLSNHTNTEHVFLVLFASLLSGWTTTTGKLLCPKGK